jgi:hypothetical protein
MTEASELQLGSKVNDLFEKNQMSQGMLHSAGAWALPYSFLTGFSEPAAARADATDSIDVNQNPLVVDEKASAA